MVSLSLVSACLHQAQLFLSSTEEGDGPGKSRHSQCTRKHNPKPGCFPLLSEPQAGPPAPSITTKLRVELADRVQVRQDPGALSSLFSFLRSLPPWDTTSSFRPMETEDTLSVSLRSFDFGNFSSFLTLAQIATCLPVSQFIKQAHPSSLQPSLKSMTE